MPCIFKSSDFEKFKSKDVDEIMTLGPLALEPNQYTRLLVVKLSSKKNMRILRLLLPLIKATNSKFRYEMSLKGMKVIVNFLKRELARLSLLGFPSTFLKISSSIK